MLWLRWINPLSKHGNIRIFHSEFICWIFSVYQWRYFVIFHLVAGNFHIFLQLAENECIKNIRIYSRRIIYSSFTFFWTEILKLAFWNVVDILPSTFLFMPVKFQASIFISCWYSLFPLYTVHTLNKSIISIVDFFRESIAYDWNSEFWKHPDWNLIRTRTKSLIHCIFSRQLRWKIFSLTLKTRFFCLKWNKEELLSFSTDEP